jgi:hypothetical protein
VFQHVRRDGRLSPWLTELLKVGFLAEHREPRLQTMQAYDLAYKKLYEALPDSERQCF